MQKVTLQQVVNFKANARNYLSKVKEQSKLSYALTKMLNRIESIVNDYRDAEEEIRVDLASVDKTTNNLIVGGGVYSYTKENAKALHKRLRELKDMEVEIEPYIATQLPKDMEAVWFEFFVPFVIEDKEP